MEAARCKSIEVTTAAGTLTAASPISCAPVYDDEVIEKVYSNSRQPSVYAGNEVKGLRITVCDTEFWDKLKKGTRITGAVSKVESAIDVDGTLLQAGDLITHTIGGGGAYVADAVEGESSQDGSPIEYTFYLKLCRSKAGTEGTFESVVAGGAG